MADSGFQKIFAARKITTASPRAPVHRKTMPSFWASPSFDMSYSFSGSVERGYASNDTTAISLGLADG